MRKLGLMLHWLGWGIFVLVSAIWAAISGWSAATGNAAVLGIPDTYINLIGTVGVVGACFMVMLAATIERCWVRKLLDPRRRKIRDLRGIETEVKDFLLDRDCSSQWQECASMLAQHLIDARRCGLYGAPQFSGERAAFERQEDEWRVFVNVCSMMRRKRHRPKDTPPGEEAVREFQEFILEDIAAEIAIEAEQIGDFSI